MSVIPDKHAAARPPQPPVTAGFEHINRYWDRTHDCHAAKILPGEYYVTAHDEIVTTVLGSCVAACIRDRRFGIGGMNHFMLPHGGPGHDRWEGTGVASPTRYGIYAMEHMINEILKLGGMKRNLEVKVFGGGKIIPKMSDVGERNILFVREYLAQEGLSIAGEDMGDIYPRKVAYYPATGRVLVKKLRSLHNDTILKREAKYMHEIEEQPVVSEVELFT